MKTKRNGTSVNKKLKLFGGVDLHKTNFYVCIIDQQGRKIDAKKIGTSEKEIKEYFLAYVGLDIVIAVEIGNPTFWFCDVLNEMGIKTYIVNTLKNSQIANSKRKTDKKDAKNLAIALWKDNLPEEIYKPAAHQRQLRTLLAHRYQYVRDRVRVVNRAHAFLSRHGMKVRKRALRESLNYWEELFVRLKDEGEFILAQLRLYHRDLKHLLENIKNLEDRMQQLIKSFPDYLEAFNILNSVPGIGPITATALIASVGDWSRFKSGKSLTAYFGLAPSNRESSDKKLRGHGAITKEGSPLVRSYMTQGVLSLLMSSKQEARPLQQWHENIKKRKGWKKARIALVRKLCEIVFAMVKSRKSFDPLLLTKNSQPAI